MSVRKYGSALICGLALAGAALAQQEPAKPVEPPKFYRLDFVVKELARDKVIESRSYSVLTFPGSPDGAAVRSNSRVPFFTSTTGGGTQFQFHEAGVNIDCRGVNERPAGRLALIVTADITSVALDKETKPDSQIPVVRTNRWNSPVIVQLKKPSIVFTADDPSGNRRMQLELTAVPVE